MAKFPDFEIKRGNTVVGKFVNGTLQTKDPTLLGFINLGIVQRGGRGWADQRLVETESLIQSGDPGFMAAFVSAVLDEGLAVPVQITHML